jgi:hypothetical protein
VVAKPAPVVNCANNLTRVAIFYSGKDELNCIETVAAKSSHHADPDPSQVMLQCKDETLESKFLTKLSEFYFVQMEWLPVSKDKLKCIRNKKRNNRKGSFETIYLKQLNTLFVNNNSNSSSIPIVINETNVRPRVKFVYDLPNAAGSTADDEIHLTCNLITKNYNVRKRLVWRFHFMTRSEECAAPFVTSLSLRPASLVLINDKEPPPLITSTNSDLDTTFRLLNSTLTPQRVHENQETSEASEEDGSTVAFGKEIFFFIKVELNKRTG